MAPLRLSEDPRKLREPLTGVQFVHQCLVTLACELIADESEREALEPPRTPGNAKVMGAPEVLGEQVSTPFAGHDLPCVLREQLHGLSDPSDPRRFV